MPGSVTDSQATGAGGGGVMPAETRVEQQARVHRTHSSRNGGRGDTLLRREEAAQTTEGPDTPHLAG